MPLYLKDKLVSGTGAQGSPGKSAYQTAVEAGYKGDEAAFNSALKDVPAHIANKDNPHGVTAAQVDAYTKDEANALLQNKIDTYSGAGAHNAIYRGKYLGDSVTAEQYAAIAAGTFDDLYIGDYWTIGGVNYRIAAFDYYYRSGDNIDITTHHVTLVPDTALYSHVMNDDNTTEGGYIGSKMKTSGLDQAVTTINNAFGSAHILTRRELFTNAVSNGKPSGGSWYDSTVDLMTEQNVYGSRFFAPAPDGTTIPYQYVVDKSQYPLFAFRPDLISNRVTYWLRDVVSAANFAGVLDRGCAYCYGASSARGVRPAFSIKA